MDEVKSYRNKITYKSFIIFSTVFVIFAVININNDLWKALLFGYFLSLMNFFLLAKDVAKLPYLGKGGAKGIFTFHFFLRYGIIGLGIYAAFSNGYNIYAFVAGLFLIQLTIYIDNFIALK